MKEFTPGQVVKVLPSDPEWGDTHWRVVKKMSPLREGDPLAAGLSNAYILRGIEPEGHPDYDPEQIIIGGEHLKPVPYTIELTEGEWEAVLWWDVRYPWSEALADAPSAGGVVVLEEHEARKLREAFKESPPGSYVGGEFLAKLRAFEESVT